MKFKSINKKYIFIISISLFIISIFLINKANYHTNFKKCWNIRSTININIELLKMTNYEIYLKEINSKKFNLDTYLKNTNYKGPSSCPSGGYYIYVFNKRTSDEIAQIMCSIHENKTEEMPSWSNY